MQRLDKFRHGKGTGRLYYINNSLENPLAMDELTEWEIQDIQPHIPVIETILRHENIQGKQIVVKLRSKKSDNEHIPQNEFRVSQRVSDINGFIRTIGVFENPNVADDDINKHIVVMPYIHGGSLMQFQTTEENQLKSLVAQATLSLAEAFLKYGFLHPELHWCNVLLETTDETEVSYEIGTETITVPTHGHKVVITELNKAHVREYDVQHFWYYLKRFYTGHLDIYRKQDTARDWNNGSITTRYMPFGKTITINNKNLTGIVKLINQSSFSYYGVPKSEPVLDEPICKTDIRTSGSHLQMRILVSGGVGFIGSNLIKRLLNEGHEVHCIDDYSTGSVENQVEGCQYKIACCNFLFLPTEKYDVIFHLAALARIAPSFEKPQQTFDANVAGTQRMLEYARSMNAKFIYAGSSSRWHDPTSSPYATSKYLGEQLCQMYRKSFGSKIQIARFYNVYGPNEIVGGEYATVIGIWRRQVKNGEPITIVGDGEQRRDFTHVSDIVDGLVRIMTTEHFHDDAWELGTGINYSINQIYEFFKERFGSPCVHLPDRKGNYKTTLREHDDALDILGWKPRDQLREYIMSLDLP